MSFDLFRNSTFKTDIHLVDLRSVLLDLNFAFFQRDILVDSMFDKDLSEVQQIFFVAQSINLFRPNSTEEHIWPQRFIDQCSSIFGEKLTLNSEILKQTDQSFNTVVSHQQLMKFLNNMIIIEQFPIRDESIEQFLIDLTNKDPTTTSKLLSSFTCLADIPMKHIQIRSILIYLFNLEISPILAMLDLSVKETSNVLVDKIRSARDLIFSSVKDLLLEGTLSETATASGISVPSVAFDTIKASECRNQQDTFFYQAFQQLFAEASDNFRREHDEPCWSAEFTDMFSIDRGGPYRDSITRMCSEICSSKLSLFILCPNGRTETGTNRDQWIPNVFPPNRRIPDDMKNQYRFFGQLMGMALRTRNYLEVRLARLVWKELIGDSLLIEDIQIIDNQSFAMINQMEENIRQIINSDQSSSQNIELDFLFTSVMSELKFDVVSSNGETFELIPGGFEIPINSNNFQNYCTLYRDYRLNEFRRQIDLIREGLYSVVPCSYLTLFTADELEEAVCGKTVIDIELLKRHTTYSTDDDDEDESEDKTYIDLFWKVMTDMFSEEQKKLFLIFVWGRGTLPRNDEHFSTNFVINRLDVSGNVDEALPSKNFELLITKLCE